MGYVSPRGMWLVFSSAVVILIVLGLMTAGVTSRYAETEDWISHTHQVETAVARVRADLFAAEASRLQFVLSGDETLSLEYRKWWQALEDEFATLQHLTRDNPSQNKRTAALKALLSRQQPLMDESVNLRGSGQRDDTRQQQLNEASSHGLTEAALLLRAMREEESQLMQARVVTSSRALRTIVYALALTGFVVLLIVAAAWRLLMRELAQRREAEAAIRRLSGRILYLQDIERRKVARDLHDSLGQSLAAVAMNLSILKDSPAITPEKRAALIEDSLSLISQAVNETRTISHLLHPPLLDEAGFASAAKWYLDGFTRRSGIPVKLEITSNVGRLPHDAELVLFRALQEGLTNVHKHAGNCEVTVRVVRDRDIVRFTIRDNGKGIPLSVLNRFQGSGAGAGVGLAGMRERVMDVGGSFDLHSSAHGTVLQIELPPHLSVLAEAPNPSGDGRAVPLAS